MPTRATKRGAERTPLSGEYDVIVCGASFAGLTVARQLTGSGARVLLLDRYEIGERQTSACGIPTEVAARNMGLEGSAKQEFPALVVHTPHGTSRYELPWTLLDLRLPRALQDPRRPERRRVRDREGERPHRRHRPHRPRRRLGPADRRRARLAPDLSPRTAATSRPTLRSRAGSRSTPTAAATTSRSGSTAATCPPATAGAFRPAARSASGSARSTRSFHVKDTTVLLSDDLERPPVRYQGNWIPHKLRAGHRGRDLLRRRLGRPLPAADRRGDPHRASTSGSSSATSCGRSSRAARTAAPRCAPTRPSPTTTSGSSAGCCGRRSWCRSCRRACSAP